MSKTLLTTIIITVIVLVSFAIAFLGTYYFYYVEKKKVINEGIDDNEINEEIKKHKNKFNKKNIKDLSFKDFYFKKKKRNKVIDRIFGIIFGIILVVICVFLSFGYIKTQNNELTFINDKTVLVIKTDSMEEINDDNTYLKDENNQNYKYINTRLEALSLISIDRYDESKELNLYDIVAFKMDDTIIVHRLIKINIDEKTKETTYTFRGDANNASFTNESNVKKEDILGIYNGYKNVPLGYIISFFQSEIGLISIIIVAICLITYELFNDGIDTIYSKRMEELIIKDKPDFIKKIENKKIELIENKKVRKLTNNSLNEDSVITLGEKEETIDFNKDDLVDNSLINEEEGVVISTINNEEE